MFFDLEADPLAWALNISMVMLMTAMGLALWRIYKGPTIMDRIVSLELLAGICLSIFVLLAIRFDQSVLLDSALAIAVISFLGTVAFARYLEREDAKE